MTEQETLAFHVLMRRKFNHLTDLLKVSQELGGSIDKKDQILVVKFLEERHGILWKLSENKDEISKALEEVLEKDGRPERKRIRSLLHGRGEPLNKKEEALKAQSFEAEKLYQEVLELDQRLNRHLANQAKASHS